MGGGTERPRAADDVQIRTFLIADVRGYTLFTQERGDEVAAKLAAKFADLAQEVVEARGGTLLELRGDEALCVFASTREAIRAAVDLQERFVEETLEDPELPLTVGIGIDAGEAVRVGDGYRGGALNLAARLCGVAKAGEILASREATHLARAVEGARYADRGAMTFKNLPDPVAVVAVVPLDGDPVERLKPFGRAPTTPPRRNRRTLAIVAAVVVVIALIAVAVPLLSPGGGGALSLGSNSVASIDLDGTLRFQTALHQRPTTSASGFGSLWVVHPDRGIVTRVSLANGSIQDAIPVGSSPSSIAVGNGSVWVTNEGDGTVSRIDPESGQPSDELPAGTAPSGIAVGGGELWVADSVGASLLRIDPVSRETKTIRLSGLASSVIYTPDGIWVTVQPDKVVRVDPNDGTVAFDASVGSDPTAVISAFGSIWVANHFDSSVTRVSPDTGSTQATIPVGDGPVAFAAAGGRLWVAAQFADTVVEIDPTTNGVVRRLATGGPPSAIEATGDGLWLAVGASATEHRGGTLTVTWQFPEPPETLDPAITYNSFPDWAVLSITNDGLLGYQRVGGADGATLVPDLAEALPEISADGLTYRFALRQGIHYSDGQPVRPEDFRRALERSIGLSADAASLFRALDGAVDCHRAGAECDLTDSIVTDDTSVTFHLARPDADLPYKLAMTFAFAVPASTPIEDQGVTPLPATGPYLVERVDDKGLELVRNPRFSVWSNAAQPDGYVDRISIHIGVDPAAAYDALTAGTADLMNDAPPPEELAALRAASPDQVITFPSGGTIFVSFDTTKPPFDDARVRQAVSFALDRGRIASLLGTPDTELPTCQVIPPNFQGYMRYCPFTVDPSDGMWSAPDLERARELIDAAGAADASVTVQVPRGTPFFGSSGISAMRYLTSVLDDLGLDARLKVIANPNAYFNSVFGTPAGTPEHPQAFLAGWLLDYPAASSFLTGQFECTGNGNASGFCDHAIDARIDHALATQVTDPGAANREWASIEHDLVDLEVQVDLVNPVASYAVSARAGNVQVNPEWGVLLSRIWVR